MTGTHANSQANAKFWMVTIEDGGKPNQPYLTHEGALSRAKFLARQTHKRVFILEAVQVVTALVPETAVTFDIQEVK